MQSQWLAVALALASGLGACSGRHEAVQPPPPLTVEVAAPRPSSATRNLRVSGTVARQREIALSFRIQGVLTSLRVDAGDSVKAGEILASLDPAAVKARQTQAAADLERAKRDLERDRTLFASGYVSQQRVDDRLTAVKTATAAYEAAAFDGRWAQLVSPVSGVVLARRVQNGEVVQPGQTVLQLGDTSSPLIVRAPIADRDVSLLKLGQTVTVSLDKAQTLTGQISRIGQQANSQTGAVEIEVTLPKGSPLRSGQIVDVALALLLDAHQAKWMRIPAEAILEATPTSARVFVIDGSGQKVRNTTVSFSGFDGDDALVSGLAPQARVVTSGAGFLVEGATVTVAAGPQS